MCPLTLYKKCPQQVGSDGLPENSRDLIIFTSPALGLQTQATHTWIIFVWKNFSWGDTTLISAHPRWAAHGRPGYGHYQRLTGSDMWSPDQGRFSNSL